LVAGEIGLTLYASSSPPTRTPNHHTIDTHDRRAKRLKKLNRIMTSSSAQSSTLRFKHQTWLVIAIILGAHVMGYAVLSTEIERRFE